VSLPPPLDALLRPDAYAHPVTTVELVETHISWVLLAGEFAYKIKRPVRYDFVDLSDADRRRFFCEEELRLNRRFAPELYLDVCAIVSRQGEVRIGGSGCVLEHAVRMRRFSRRDELDQLLEQGTVEPSELEDFGRTLARIHAQLPVAAASSHWGCPAEVQALLIRNLKECAEAGAVFGASDAVLALRASLERHLPAAAPWMAARRIAGRVRECHGDLHTRNIVRRGAGLVAFDCMEFEPAFRWIDVADEIALLLSDLEARGHALHAHAFRGAYLAASGDYQACRVLELYKAHRSLVRAKVAALTARALTSGPREGLRLEHARLLEGAAAALGTHTACLIVMCGVSGSGKTWLARLLAPRLAAVHLRSDVERKRRAGLGELASSGSQLYGGLYTPEASAALYASLAQFAEHVLSGGYNVIVDASFALRRERARFLRVARRAGVPLRVLYCEASSGVLRARIAARRQSASDASEADQRVLESQLRDFEAVSADEELDVLRIDTSEPDAAGKALEYVNASLRSR